MSSPSPQQRTTQRRQKINWQTHASISARKLTRPHTWQSGEDICGQYGCMSNKTNDSNTLAKSPRKRCLILHENASANEHKWQGWLTYVKRPSHLCETTNSLMFIAGSHFRPYLNAFHVCMDLHISHRLYHDAIQYAQFRCSLLTIPFLRDNSFRKQ